MTATELSPSLVKASDVIGTSVKNLQKENLGKIEEVILDKLTGRTVYAVLSFGGFLGMGDKYFALPWQILKYDQSDESFIINIDKEKLKNAPGFDKNNWPDMNDHSFSSTVNQYYGTLSERKY